MKIYSYTPDENEDPSVEGVKFFGIYFKKETPTEVDDDEVLKYLAVNNQFTEIKSVTQPVVEKTTPVKRTRKKVS